MTLAKRIEEMFMDYYVLTYGMSKARRRNEARIFANEIIAICQPPKIDIIKKADLAKRLGDGTASGITEQDR